MSKTTLIISREYLSRVKKRSFIIMTLLGPILMGGLMFLAIFLSQQEKDQQQVVIADVDHQFFELGVLDSTIFKDSSTINYHFHDGTMSDEAFEQSPYDILVELNASAITDKVTPMVYKESPSFVIQERISNNLEKVYEELLIAKKGWTREEYDDLIAKVDLAPREIFKGEIEEIPREIGYGVGFGLSIIIYIFIFVYGAQIMRGVMEEKSSRIVEVIVSSVKPFQLMMGKIIGVALVGLTQFLIWIVFTSIIFGVFALFFPDTFAGAEQMEMAQEQMANVSTSNEMSMVWEILHRTNFTFIIVMFLFYFLGGYLMYGSLFAAIGGAVDHESDTQQFMFPIVMPMVFAFIIAELSIANPDSTAVFWTSIIPFTSPIVMMVQVGQMGMGFVPYDWTTIILSMTLLIGGFIFTTWLAGRIYRTGILMYGKKVSYKEIWKWLTYRI